MRTRRGNSWPRARNGGDSSLRDSLWRRPGQNERSPFLVQLIDGCLLSLLFIAPLLMGGRHPVGQFAWMLIAAVLGLATLFHYRSRRPSAGDFVWLAAAGLVTLQLVPLPTDLLVRLNPGISQLLPGMTNPAALPFSEAIYSNRPISVNPYRTRLALGMLLAYGIIFHSVTRRVQTTADVRRLLKWIAIATVAISVLALAQRFAGNGKFLWIYQHISRSASNVVKGPFQNQNHLAQLMALGLGPLLYFTNSQSGHWKTVLGTSGATLCLLSGLLTFSRGGAIAIATAGCVSLAGLAYTEHINRKNWLRLVLPAMLTFSLLVIWGGEKLLTRVETLAKGADISSISPARLELWQSHLRAISASPWVGYGAASHEEIYPAFIKEDFGVKFTHGESGYLPIQLENGVVGTMLLAYALLLAGWWAWQSLRIPTRTVSSDRRADDISRQAQSLAVVCLAGIAASAVHSLGDFVWYIPACLTPTLMLLACLSTLASQKRASAGSVARQCLPPFRLPWLAVPSAVLMAAVTWSVGPARASHLWTKHRDLVRKEAAERTADASPQVAAYTEAIPLLSEIIRRDPLNPLPRLRLACTLVTIVDHQEQRTVTPNQKLLNAAIRQAIIGLRSAPLRGEGYIWLTYACDRSGSDRDTGLALLEQSLRVRQCDTSIRYRAGLAAFQRGQPQWGLTTWKSVLKVPTPERDQILLALADLLPADILLQTFSLDHTALEILFRHHRTAHPPDTQLSLRLGDRLVSALTEAANSAANLDDAASLFHKASCILHEMKAPSHQVLDLALQAAEASPLEYRYRLRLAILFIEYQRLEEATVQLQWCRSRRPLDPHLARQEMLLTEAKHAR